MSVEDVRRNYNAVGLKVVEAMFGDDYLSIGGVESTTTLAEAAGITGEHHVLDVGCGIGGPALHLASTIGCRVQGLDLVDISVAETNQRAVDRGLDHLVKAVEGDATDMPFGDAEFDVVWGQDAWCHVVDKSALVSECFRVLTAGGIVAFTDWVVTGEMSGSEREKVLSAAASTEMATSAEYRDLLGSAGFVNLEELDVSEVFADQYRSIYAGLRHRESELVDTYSRKVFDIIAGLNGTINDAFSGGLIGGRRFIAHKP
ncbi:MAG: class I SAM-dependent methyltransferase [Acidimicrobiales bacterium]